MCVCMCKILNHFCYVGEGAGEDGGSGVGQRVNGTYIQVRTGGGRDGRAGGRRETQASGGVEMRNGEVTRKTVRRL